MPESVNGYETYRAFCLAHKPERCEICGETEDVLVHHLDGDRNNNNIDNLVPLCPSHHSRIHWGHEEYDEYVKHLPEDSLYTIHRRESTPSLKEVGKRLVRRMLIGGGNISVAKAVDKHLPTYSQEQVETLINEMLKDPYSPIEGYGGGARGNIRLVSIESAVEYLKENDGNVPFGYD